MKNVAVDPQRKILIFLPGPQYSLQIITTRSMQLRATHATNKNAIIKQTMQLKFPENVTVHVPAQLHVSNTALKTKHDGAHPRPLKC